MDLKTEFQNELINNILPYWTNKMQDNENGGFYGRIDGNDFIHKDANKGAILNTRILWTFSAAYRIFKQPSYLEIANRAFNYINDFFIDSMWGGVFWELDATGNPINRKKQLYAQAFALFSYSEYYLATGDEKALEQAKEIFSLLDQCCDRNLDGYFEAFSDKWSYIEDMRLSNKDANERKTMNTHLHIMESFTNLYRAWKDERVKNALERIINIFTDRILDKKTNHLNLFFDKNWNLKSSTISFGHDIESAWLLYEAAEVLGNEELINSIKDVTLKIVDATLEGLDDKGGMIYEIIDGVEDRDCHWWVQAEAVVGLMFAWKISGNITYREKALKNWEFIKRYIIDYENGDWFWSSLPDGKPNKKDDKAGFWKCCYHNARMCMEMMKLIELPI